LEWFAAAPGAGAKEPPRKTEARPAWKSAAANETIFRVKRSVEIVRATSSTPQLPPSATANFPVMLFKGTSKNPTLTPLPRILPRFFGKKPRDTTSIPAFFACESQQAPRQIRAHIVFRSSLTLL
jgi:hypothetical protein